MGWALVALLGELKRKQIKIAAYKQTELIFNRRVESGAGCGWEFLLSLRGNKSSPCLKQGLRRIPLNFSAKNGLSIGTPSPKPAWNPRENNQRVLNLKGQVGRGGLTLLQGVFQPREIPLTG